MEPKPPSDAEPQPARKPDKLWVHWFLFFGTIVTTFSAWVFIWGDPRGSWADRFTEGALFSFTALAILGAHEMGHFLMARHHKVDSSPPYFLPFPTGFGTLGAVIRLRGRVTTRDALVDIGAAGPLAGLCVALPLYIAGVLTAPEVVDPGKGLTLVPGPFSLWELIGQLVDWLADRGSGAGETAQQAMYFGDSLLSLGLLKLVRHVPKGHELGMGPVLMGAWFGLLVTMLNLLPVGQLDGGHLTHAWFGPRAILIGKGVALFLVVLVIACSASWLLWLFLTTRVIGYDHPPVVLPNEPLSTSRKVICAICFVFAVLLVMPVPMGATL